MNTQHRPMLELRQAAMAVALAMAPSASLAQGETPAGTIPVEMDMTVFLIIGGLLILSILLLFVFQKRFRSIHRELTDIAAELNHARQRLTETNQLLEETEQDLQSTTRRYQGILYDAQVGMFQMDLDGTTTYINSTLEKLSGLYPKKAMKEGIQCAIHPDDRDRFDREWKAFVEGDNNPLSIRFRFKRTVRGSSETHVLCKATKVLNSRKDAESYIGWITDITPFREEHLQQEAATSRYARFIDETIEGHYQLVPQKPIPLSDSPEKMAKAIMSGMALASCNETFAALYGSTPAALEGKQIDALDGGCGPLRNSESIKQLIESEYKLIDLESVRQDPRGNRLILLNHVVGLVEDNKLVGIWGSQRNISRQKREMEALASQAQFMHRILDALPADVHVKDTRCRYLYASRKLAERTGIPQEEWIGKTIFEILPATPRNHDKSAIEVMKSGKLSRTERTFETPGKTGYMETLQIPLVSDDGLVEGMVGLSIDITERKEKEAEARRGILRKLQLRDAELEEKQQEFLEKINLRKQAEAELRQNEKELLSRQRELKEQLAQRQAKLEAETGKRRKWEELISIKEDELRKAQSHLKKTETLLQKTQEKIKELSKQHATELEHEISERNAARAQLLRNTAELDELKQQFSLRIEQETRQLKKELAQKQIREKALRQQEKKLEAQIKQLEKTLQLKTKEHNDQLQAHEKAEALRRQAEQKLEQINTRQSQLVERETQKLSLNIAEIQLGEVRLRKQIGDLQAEKEQLENELKEMNLAFEASQKNVESMVEQQTEALKNQIERHRQNEARLKAKIEQLLQASGMAPEKDAPIEWSAKPKQKIAGVA